MKMKFKLFNEAGMHLNGRVTYTAAATIVRGDVLKFSEGKVTPCTDASDAAIGVALDGASSGDIVAVAVLGSFTGTVVVKAGGAISQGAKVTAVGTAAGTGAAYIGTALEAATNSGDLIEVAHCVPASGVPGLVTMTAGAAVAVGKGLKLDASGKAIAVTAKTDTCIGVALTAASAADDVITVATPGSGLAVPLIAAANLANGDEVTCVGGKVSDGDARLGVVTIGANSASAATVILV